MFTTPGSLAVHRADGRISKSSVRVYVERVRLALALVFRAANLRINVRDVLASEGSGTNEALYRLRGTFDWVHTDHPGREFAWVK
jgi:hypothetical protein